MNGLNDAFERLREVVPNLTTEQKMSKIETLHMAQTYIKALASLIEREERKELLGGVDMDPENSQQQLHQQQHHTGETTATGYHDIKMEPVVSELHGVGCETQDSC